MRKADRLTVAAAFLLTAAVSMADGGGGIMGGMEHYDSKYSSADLGTSLIGGYGYGTSEDGERTGGFGLAMFGMKDSPGMAGGFGGLLLGSEANLGPLQLALDLLLGVGGVWQHEADDDGTGGGMMAAYGEIDLSLGIRLTRWMRLAAYAGFQGFGNLFPGEPFRSLLYYAPVIGVRVAWGSF